MKVIALQFIGHLVVGGMATFVDLIIFTLLTVMVPIGMLAAKVISFLVSVALKYMGNKHWVFKQYQKENWRTELSQFFFITLVGLLLDVAAFYYFTELLGPQFGAPEAIWQKLSVIFAALAAAVWNFLGYKLLVFKK